MIRRAIPRDIQALVGLALRCIRGLDTGDLVISSARIEAALRRLVSDPSSLVLVSGTPIDGAIAVQVNDGCFYERKSAGIIFWYSGVPGIGYALLKRALKWADSRPAIKAIGLSQDFGGDARVGKLLERAGLKYRGSVYARY